MPFKGNFATITAWKSFFWTREGGRGSFFNSMATGSQDVAWDNQFQVPVYDSQGNFIPSFLASDVNGAFQVNNPNGLVIGGAISQPAAPTVTPNTTGGATTVAYAIVTRTSSGKTTQVSTATQITTSQAVLSASVFNTIVGTKQVGAAYYDIYRTVAGGTPNTTGKIGTVAANTLLNTPSATTFTFVDNGLAGDGTTAPATNTTGGLVAPGGVSIGNSFGGVATFLLTAANILSMFGTPVTVIPAAGTGKLIVCGDPILFQMKPGATAFVAGGAVSLVYHGTAVSPHSSNIPAATVNSAVASNNVLPPIAAVIQPPTNVGVDITNATASFTTGNGTAILTIPYSIITLG